MLTRANSVQCPALCSVGVMNCPAEKPYMATLAFLQKHMYAFTDLQAGQVTLLAYINDKVAHTAVFVRVLDLLMTLTCKTACASWKPRDEQHLIASAFQTVAAFAYTRRSVACQ